MDLEDLRAAPRNLDLELVAGAGVTLVALLENEEVDIGEVVVLAEFCPKHQRRRLSPWTRWGKPISRPIQKRGTRGPVRAHFERFWLLYAVILAGAIVRLVGIDFADGIPKARPDEELFIQQALFLFSGDMNPHWAANGWPELYFFLVHFALRLKLLWLEVGQSTPVHLGCLYVLDPNTLGVPARLVAWTFGVATIPLTYLFARSVHQRFGALAHPGAIAAAAIMAFNVLHVRDSHFAVSDTAVVFFMTLGLWQLARALEGATLRSLLYAAAAFGLGTSIKYTALVMLGMLFLAGAARFFRMGPAQQRRRVFYVCIAALAVFGLAFILGSPHFVTESSDFFDGLMSHQVRYSERGARWGYDSGRQLQRGISFHGLVSIPTAMGWPAAILALAGVGRALFSARGGAFFVALFVLFFYGMVLGPSTILFMRYTQPLFPALAVLAVLAPLELAHRYRLDIEPLSVKIRAGVAVALALVLPAMTIAQADARMLRVDTREDAIAWLDEHLGDDEVVLSQSGFLAMPTHDTEVIAACREALPDELERPVVPAAHRSAYAPLVDQGAAGWGPLVREFLSHSADQGTVSRSAYVVQTLPQLSCARVVPYGRLTELPACFREVARFEPGDSSCETLYDTYDAFMQPVTRFGGVERPGPVVVIHHNECGE